MQLSLCCWLDGERFCGGSCEGQVGVILILNRYPRDFANMPFVPCFFVGLACGW